MNLKEEAGFLPTDGIIKTLRAPCLIAIVSTVETG